MGTTISTKVFASPAPSILAASNISPGTPSENCFIRNTPKGHPTVGKITAQIVLYRDKDDISRSRGIKITCLGRAIAHTISVNSTVRPLNRFLASAYPAIADVIQVSTIAITAINTVFTSQRIEAGTTGPAEKMIGFPSAENLLPKGTASSHKGALWRLNSLLKLSITHSFGNQSGVVALIDAAVLNAPVTIQ